MEIPGKIIGSIKLWIGIHHESVEVRAVGVGNEEVRIAAVHAGNKGDIVAVRGIFGVPVGDRIVDVFDVGWVVNVYSCNYICSIIK